MVLIPWHIFFLPALGLMGFLLKCTSFIVVMCGLSCPVACGIFIPQPGIEPVPPTVPAQSLNHWTAREVPVFIFNE